MSQSVELEFDSPGRFKISIPADIQDEVAGALHDAGCDLVSVDGEQDGEDEQYDKGQEVESASGASGEENKDVRLVLVVTEKELGIILYGLRLAQAFENDMRGVGDGFPSPEEFIDGITDDETRRATFALIDQLFEKINEIINTAPELERRSVGQTFKCLDPKGDLFDRMSGLLASTDPHQIARYEEIGQDIGRLVDKKNAQYGDSFNRSGGILRVLFPDGVAPAQYEDMLCLVRIIDKMFRIATAKDGIDPGGESPYRDIAGYGLLGTHRSEAARDA